MWLGDATPGVTPDPNSWAALFQGLAPLATSVVSAIDQQKLLDYNLQLIAAGKPPLTSDQMIQLSSGTTPQFNFGLSPAATNTVEEIAIGAGVLVAAFLVIHALGGGSKSRSHTMARAYNR
jgi:hypothetical protein